MTLLPARACAAAPPVVLGVNTTGMYQNMGKALDEFAARVGRMPKIAMYYQNWYEGWGTALIDRSLLDPILARGAIPMITWLPRLETGDPVNQPAYSLAAIAAGVYDPYIERAAREAAEFHHRLLLRFAHEMNGPWSPWGAGVDGNTPADYVAMWRHVVAIFRAAGATNVRWVWSPNVYSIDPFTNSGSPVPFQPFYPGNRWVDFVALDGYNSGTLSWPNWRSFISVFRNSYDAITQLTDKPMMIAETASTELGGDKAKWIRAIPHVLRIYLPAVRALIWFNREPDWKVSSSPASLHAFRAVAQSALFSGSASSLVSSSAPATDHSH